MSELLLLKSRGLFSPFGGQIGLGTLLGSYFIMMILVSQYLLKQIFAWLLFRCAFAGDKDFIQDFLYNLNRLQTCTCVHIYKYMSAVQPKVKSEWTWSICMCKLRWRKACDPGGWEELGSKWCQVWAVPATMLPVVRCIVDFHCEE